MNSIFLPQSPNEQEKYSYILKFPWILKLLYIFSALSWIITLVGYYYFLQHSFWYWMLFAPFIIFITCFHFLSLGINFFYKKFDVKKHNWLVDSFWSTIRKRFKVDVFLPICGEDIDILRNTWKGVAEIQNSLKCLNGHYSINPIVLDDKGDPVVLKLAQEFGFRYLSRPNKGEMKKAGNLKFAFENSNGDFAVILDADFRPRSDFVDELLPYMFVGKVGIVQSPQFFDYDDKMHKRSLVEFGAGSIQEYFYKIIQVARGRFDGAICVGSCAMYSREALVDIGGTVQIEHSEDIFTGFKMLSKGWKLKYIPLVLSKGVCPDDLNSFFKQQTRWCNGSMSMVLNPQFWSTKIPLITKLCYFSGFMGYISYQVTLFLVLETLILLAFYNETIGVFNLLLFVPNLINAVVIQYFYIYPRSKVGTIIGHAAATWFYNFTVISLLFSHIEGWSPTGLKSKMSKGFLISLIAPGVYAGLIMTAILVMTILGYLDVYNYYLYPILFWIFMSLIYHLSFWLYGVNYLNNEDQQKLPWLARYQKIILPLGLVLIMGIMVLAVPSSLPNKQKITPENILPVLNPQLSKNSPELRLTNKIIIQPDITVRDN